MSNYMSNAVLQSLDVGRLEAFRMATDGRKRPRITNGERILWYDRDPSSLERCRALALGEDAKLRAPITERLHCCLYALSRVAPKEWHFGHEAITHRIQSTLSQLLIDHPVLMHPVLLCLTAAKGGTGAYIPMPFVVTGARYGRLPSRDDGYGDEALRNWVRSPGVMAGLVSCAPMRNSLIDPLVAGRRPLEVAFNLRDGCLGQMIVSVHELLELHDGGKQAVDIGDVLKLLNSDSSARMTLRFCDVLIRSLDETSGAAARFPDWVRDHLVDMLPEMVHAVGVGLATAILPPKSPATRSQESITERVRRYAAGLVRAGLFTTGSEAAAQILKGCAGRYHDRLDSIEVAVELLRVLREFGVTPAPNQLMPEGFGRKEPAPSWQQALAITAAEASMAEVMDALDPELSVTTAPSKRAARRPV